MQVVQEDLTPVVLISAESLLLLSITNRLSHLTNRARALIQQDQMDVIYKRIVRMQYAVGFALLSIIMLLSVILGTLGLEITRMSCGQCIFGCFAMALFFMIVSVVLFGIDTMHASMIFGEVVTNLHQGTLVRSSGTPLASCDNLPAILES